MKILITGGTNGMGKGVAIELAKANNNSNEIIILCRSKELGEKVKKEIIELSENEKISLIISDLANLDSVKSAISEIRTKETFLDAIFINAGLGYAENRVETIDGMDSHFQVNYLSHFYLTLNLLELLEKSKFGPRVIFNATNYGQINWNDIQLKEKWNFKEALFQTMLAKRLLLKKLHNIYFDKLHKISFIGFHISQTVWTNQIEIIPNSMRFMAKVVKFFGGFISIEKCGEIMAPLFTESFEESLQKSGKLITFKRNKFEPIEENENNMNEINIERLWNISLELCNDESTSQIANSLGNQ